MTRSRDLTFVLAITMAALLLRMWGINTDLWLDEITTVIDYMRLSPIETARTFSASNQHLLNSLLGGFSIRLLGEHSWSVRLPAMLFGVATVPVFFYLARAVTQRREAVFATLFLTLSYHHVWFSQNARGYSSMIFFTVLSTLFLVRWLKDSPGGGNRDWLWFALSGALGMLSLVNFAFVLCGQFVAVMWLSWRGRNWTRIRLLLGLGLLILMLSIIGYGGAILTMLDYYSTAQPLVGWQNPFAFFQVVASGLTNTSFALAVPVIVCGGILALGGWVSYLARKPLIALMLVLPAFFNVVALVVLNWGAFPRSFLYVLPFGILVVTRGAFIVGEWMVPRLKVNERAAYALPMLLLLASMVVLSHNYRYPKQDYTGALAYAREQAAPGDTIAVVGYLNGGYRKYYAPDLVFCRSVADLTGLRATGQRIWLLHSFTRDLYRFYPDVRDYIRTEFEPQRKFIGTLGDGTIYLSVTPSEARPGETPR